MLSKTLTIGAKGQITLPKKIRDLFGGESVTIELIDEKHAIISPLQDVGGALSKYAKNSNLPFEKAREMAWKKSSNAK